ncbi:MAG: bifunctional folylpolyglutamate synthase/dihydrofolate synthase [Planctomycetota bacterium]|jgi:dihydrofolate synthase/folylpolyglutamate synthase
MNRILSVLEKPHKRYKTVHIAGTKGKGSTANMLSSMLSACGMKVGLYTSPHLLNIRERISVDGEMITESEFAKSIGKVVASLTKARATKPTYFEVLTAAAFQYFADREVEVAVIETGLGGRLDSTNVITPDVVGITSISYDHLEQLGSDLESITREKAGIMKKGVPVVSSPQEEVVRKTLSVCAEETGSPLRFSNEGVDFSYRFEFSRSIGRHARICLTTANSRFEHLHVPLHGEHQAANCGLALTMLDVLKQRGFAVDDHKAMSGLANVNMAGRMEIIRERPRILVDGAHNAASIDALMRAIGQNVTYDSMIVIFACHKDKDIAGMLGRLQLGADKIIFTRTPSPRSADPAELAAAYTERCGKMAQVAETLEEAVRIAQSAITREDIICITGSFYLVAEAIRKFKGEVSAEAR